jgi:hypothetical protein
MKFPSHFITRNEYNTNMDAHMNFDYFLIHFSKLELNIVKWITFWQLYKMCHTYI